MKCKFTNELEKLEILEKLRILNHALDVSKSHDVSLLASRLSVDEKLLLEVLLALDVCIYNDGKND